MSGRTSPLNQRHDHVLVMVARLVDAVAFLPFDLGFVHLDDATEAAHRREATVPHGLADAVREEPSRLVRDPKDVVQLVRRAAIIRAAKQVRTVARFEYGRDSSGRERYGL